MNSQTFLDLIRRSSNLVTGLKYKNSPPEICSMDNCEIIIPTKLFTYSVIKEFFDGTYEKKERYLIKKYLKPTDRVLELGGGVGVVSCMTNKILSDPKAHIVIEANPNLIPTLETNRDRNNCKFKIIQCDPTSSGSGKLFVNKNAWASSTIKGQGEYINIPTRSWSYINKETGLDPTVLIMDIEGGELGFLRENEELLSNLRLAIIEFHPLKLKLKGLKECKVLLGRAGLECVDRIGCSEVWSR